MTKDMTELLEAIDQAATEVADLTITYGRIWQGLGKLGLAADSNEWMKRWRALHDTERDLESLLVAMKADEVNQ
jgi:hypothetical protein